MIRFLIDQFRNAPGPLKKPRILAADLAEEVLDLAGNFLKRENSSSATCCSGVGSAAVPSAAPAASSSPSAPAAPAAPESTVAAPVSVDKKEIEEEKKTDSDIDVRLTAAMEVASNVRKQEFKVLAILWDARSRDMGALSAKAISEHGENKLNLLIRHENVRKVIRMRLENFVKVHAQGVGKGTVYNYEMAPSGAEYFETTYLS